MGIRRSNNTRLFLDAYDLSLGGREIDWSDTREGVDVTVLTDSETRMTPDIPAADITYTGLYQTKETGPEEGLRSTIESTGTKVISLFLGTTENDKASFTRVYTGRIQTAPRLGEALPLTGGFITDRAMEYGRILFPKTTVTSSSEAGNTLDGIRDGASSGSTGGVVWGYHIFALSSSATRHVNVQHASSDEDSAFDDFDADSSVAAIGAARNLATGTLKRFVRLLVQEGSSGSDSSVALAAFIRRL